MAFKIITVPLPDTQEREQEVNHFLATHAVVGVQRRFIERGEDAFVVFLIEYAVGSSGPGPGREGQPQEQVDWRKELDDDQFRVFNLLRDVRRKLAEEEGVKVFNVFTNAQLVEMVRRRVATMAALKEIPKVGDGRIEKYGAHVMAVLAAEYGGDPGQAGASPSSALATDGKAT
jgi:superfamily II DNA helicase RecQ